RSPTIVISPPLSMPPPPPTPPPFPYTTLFRSNPLYGQQHNPVRQVAVFEHPGNRLQPSGTEPGADVFPYVTTTYRLTEHHTAGRSEEHTSELQSRRDLVCRLLLEKKKKKHTKATVIKKVTKHYVDLVVEERARTVKQMYTEHKMCSGEDAKEHKQLDEI